MTISLNLIAQSLHHCALLQANQILQQFIFHIFLISKWWSLKSLKLYLFSFRNHGDFHEDCMNIIMNDLIELMDPHYIEVWGKFTPRGGISIDPYTNYGRPNSKYEKWQNIA